MVLKCLKFDTLKPAGTLSVVTDGSVTLPGRPLHGCVAVVSSRFHVVITPPTADCGIFRSEETSRLDLLHSWLLRATRASTDVNMKT